LSNKQAVYLNGHPQNLVAAAMDALAWLRLARNYMHKLGGEWDEDRLRLSEAITALEQQLDGARMTFATSNKPQELGNPNPIEYLTPTELEVVRSMLLGHLTDVAIAEEIGCAASTVNSHLKHIFGKLDLDNRTALCLYALRAGWFDCYGQEREAAK